MFGWCGDHRTRPPSGLYDTLEEYLLRAFDVSYMGRVLLDGPRLPNRGLCVLSWFHRVLVTSL